MSTTKVDLIDKTFDDGGLLSKRISNYKVRPQQVELAKMIEKSIDERKPLIAEAPTGVGKSLGALVPAFEHIMKTDEPVIVTTSSIILQEQYINKDVPMLEDLYGFNVRPVLIKGRNNYMCPKKLNEAKRGKVNGLTTSAQVQEFEKVKEWAMTSNGDKATLPFNPSYGVWSKFACVDESECTGKQCPFFSSCPYFKERQRATSARLIVTNYHYFFSSLQTNAPLLPATAKVVVMDEGHEVGAIARDFQERKYHVNSLRNTFDRLAKGLDVARSTPVEGSSVSLISEMEIDEVNNTLIRMCAALYTDYTRVMNKSRGASFWTIEITNRRRLQEFVVDHVEALKHAVERAFSYLSKYGFDMESIPATVEMWGEEATEWFVTVLRTAEFLCEKIFFLQETFVLDGEGENCEDIFWIQSYNDGISVHAKPTSGAGLVGPLFSASTKHLPILMSATLAANQSFEHVKEDLGIQSPINELIVSSPFDLYENMLWYLPDGTPAGNEPGHLDFVLRYMKGIATELNGKTLCLFTSLKNLRVAEDYLSNVLPKTIQVHSQEKVPKQKLINLMKNNDNVVILGTKSFFTGVDIQGPNLSAVIIDKFPFPMLGDPVIDFLMAQPRGFHKFSLPEAIISMKQGFGRLNRTTTDKGIVAILDGRLSTAKYKNKIFNSFDHKVNATKSWDVVKTYIENMRKGDA